MNHLRLHDPDRRRRRERSDKLAAAVAALVDAVRRLSPEQRDRLDAHLRAGTPPPPAA